MIGSVSFPGYLLVKFLRGAEEDKQAPTVLPSSLTSLQENMNSDSSWEAAEEDGFPRKRKEPEVT